MEYKVIAVLKGNEAYAFKQLERMRKIIDAEAIIMFPSQPKDAEVKLSHAKQVISKHFNFNKCFITDNTANSCDARLIYYDYATTLGIGTKEILRLTGLGRNTPYRYPAMIKHHLKYDKGFRLLYDKILKELTDGEV